MNVPFDNNNPVPPLISVITVVFNGAAHLEQAVSSIESQTYRNIEYIVVDGGSTDGTLDIIKRHEGGITRWISEPDQGIYDAMNKGIRLATGDLIGLLNSDDWYESSTLEKVANAYRQRLSDNIMYHGRWNAVFEDLGVERTMTPSTAFHRLCLCHQAMFIPRKVYDAVGLYDTTYRYGADVEMVLRMRAHGIRFVLIEDALVNFRTTGTGDRNYREMVRDHTIILKKYLPRGPYLYSRILRFRYELLKSIAGTIGMALGDDAYRRMARAYLRLTSNSPIRRIETRAASRGKAKTR